MKKEATPKCKGLKRKISDRKRGNLKMQGTQKKDIRWKKRQPQNIRGSKERPLMKKDATPECNGLKKDLRWKKEPTPKRKGLKRKTANEKRGDLMNWKSGTVSSPKPASLN
jgi:hypothetical protein